MPTAKSFVPGNFPAALLWPARKVIVLILPGFIDADLRDPRAREQMVRAADEALIREYPVARLVRQDGRRQMLRRLVDSLLDEWLLEKAMTSKAGRVTAPAPAELGTGFEGFVVRAKAPRGKSAAAAVRRAVERALGAGWKARPFGKHPADFEVTSERAAFTVREAWNAVYRLREQQGIQRAEPCFAVPANQAAGARGVKFTAAGAMIAPKELSLALNNCEWSVEQVKARAAWTYSGDQGRPKQGEGTVVGHPDTGYTTHPEIWSNDPRQNRLLAEKGYDFWRNDSDARDDLERGLGCSIATGFVCFPGHGTGTCSVIMSGEGSPNGLPVFVTGIAPAAKLIPFRVAPTVVLWSPKRLAQAVYRAVDTGCHVISISMGGLPSGYLHDAVRYAVANGVIVCCAAGNYSPWVVWPAAYEEAIAVAACNAAEKPWRFSSSGRVVAVSAPGESVWRANPTDPGKPVAPSSGTSYAVATTAGVAALWMAHHGRDKLIAAVGKERIAALFKTILTTKGCNKPDRWDTNAFGAGIVDGLKVLQAGIPARSSPLAKRVKAAAAAVSAARPEHLELLENLFSGVRPGDLRRGLSTLLQATPARLPQRLREVGDELIFHYASDPEARRQFIDGLTGKAKTFAAAATAPVARAGVALRVQNHAAQLRRVASDRLAALLI